MACLFPNIWAAEDKPCFIPLCLTDSMAPVENRIYVMYHGTSAASARAIRKSGFMPSKDGMFGPGVYVTRSYDKASRYPRKLNKSRKVVLKLQVNVGKVKKIDYQGHALQKTWHSHGYGTAWCPPKCGMVSSGLEEDCVWDPRRIKVIDIIRPKKPSRNFDIWSAFL